MFVWETWGEREREREKQRERNEGEREENYIGKEDRTQENWVGTGVLTCPYSPCRCAPIPVWTYSPTSSMMEEI